MTLHTSESAEQAPQRPGLWRAIVEAFRKIRWVGLCLIAVGCILDFTLVAYPDYIAKILDAKSALADWTALEPPLRSTINHDLNWLLITVAGSELLKWILVALWSVLALTVMVALNFWLSAVLARLHRRAITLDVKTLEDFQQRVFDVRYFGDLVLIVIMVLAVLFALSADPVPGWLPVAFAAGFAAEEMWAFWEQRILLRPLPPPDRLSVAAWLVRNGWHEFLRPFLGVLLFAYFLGPAFYVAAVLLVKKITYPFIHRLSEQFAQQMFDAVKALHTIILNGTFALTFVHFEDLFVPTNGVGEGWSIVAPAVFPYAMPALLVLLLFRLGIPWSLSFSNRWAWLRLLVTFALAEVVVRGFDLAVEHGFGFSRGEAPLWIEGGALVLMFGFAFLADQSLLESWVNCPAGHRNDADAVFCKICRERLRPDPVAEHTP
jgi:hypothetical protein